MRIGVTIAIECAKLTGQEDRNAKSHLFHLNSRKIGRIKVSKLTFDTKLSSANPVDLGAHVYSQIPYSQPTEKKITTMSAMAQETVLSTDYLPCII